MPAIRNRPEVSKYEMRAFATSTARPHAAPRRTPLMTALAFLACLLTACLLLAAPAAHAAPAPPASLGAAGQPFFAASAEGDDLAADLQAAAPNLAPTVLNRALASARCALASGVAVDRPLLSVIDYSLPSTEERMWVFDLEERSLLYREIVSHGVGSGDNYARVFSNTPESRQTSLGLFLTAETYYGKNGYSMRLDGLEKDINHLARPRTIVVHGAPYVSRDFVRRVGRLGRSWGCPALRQKVARELIDTVKDGTLLFADHPEGDWLDASPYLTTCAPDVAATPATTAAR